MKLKKGVDIKELTDYGFEEINEDLLDEWGFDEYGPFSEAKGYIKALGHSRRGQCYYLICHLSGDFSLYASDPDGSGGLLSLASTHTFVQLYENGIIT